MRKSSIFLMLFLILPLLSSALELGAKLEFAGGPLLSVAGFAPIGEKCEFNLSAGGFPGIIFRWDANLKYKIERKWFPFYQSA